MSSKKKRFPILLSWLGNFLAVAGIVFVVSQLISYKSQLTLFEYSSSIWYILIGLSFIYGLSSSLLALAWKNLLSYFNSHVSLKWAYQVHGMSQLAKYVPGNVVHFASRQAMGLGSGVDGWALAKSSIWEIILLASAGVFYTLLIIPSILPASLATPIYASALIFVMLTLIFSKTYLKRSLFFALLSYLAFLFIPGMIFAFLIFYTTPELSAEFELTTRLLCSFVAAWLVGLFTPGAPAGLGVREFILFFLLKNVIPEQNLLLVVLLSRIVTVGGDILYYISASTIPRLFERKNGIKS
jgi:glycosyltransferase 2 family protein